MAHDDKMDLGNNPTQLQDVAVVRNAQTVKLPVAKETDVIPELQTPPVERAPVQPKPLATPAVQSVSPPEGATRVLLPPNWDQEQQPPAKGRPSGGAGEVVPAVGEAAAPVVGFLIVVDGPGRGQYRGVNPGANTIGRNANQRIPINFGDETISGDQQAFLVYDGRTRQFQLVPNLGKPNLVRLNDDALLTNAVLKPHDKIAMGKTTLLFVPLCGPDFDWSDMPAA